MERVTGAVYLPINGAVLLLVALAVGLWVLDKITTTDRRNR